MRGALLLLAGALAAPVAAQTIVRGSGGRMGDVSGAITTGGASQQVFPADATRRYLSCQNPIGATEPLFINFSLPATTSGSSYEIAPGGSIVFNNNFIPTDDVYVTAATTGHRFICKRA